MDHVLRLLVMIPMNSCHHREDHVVVGGGGVVSYSSFWTFCQTQPAAFEIRSPPVLAGYDAFDASNLCSYSSSLVLSSN